MIERYQLRYFLAVVDAGNFSRAAAQVNVTQPTLSVGVGKLEEALGARLFRRNSQRVHLTPEGVRLLAHARAIEAEFNGLEGRLAAADRPKPLRIGVLATIPTRLVAQVVDANREASDPEEIEVVEGNERDLLGRLARRRIDLALTLIRPGEERFANEILYREGYAMLGPPGHRLLEAPTVAGEALSNETMIVRRHCEVLPETSRYFTERGVRPRFSYRSTNDDRALALVKAGLGITVMPDSYAGDGIAVAKLAGFDQQRAIGLMFAEPDLAGRASGVLRALRALRP
jgi:DNA-binding transcriptional LysR family regulator